MTSARATALLLPVIYLGFVSLGLPDGTLGVAWPAMHVALNLPIGLAGPLLLVITVLAGISSFSSGRLIARFKTGPIVLVSGALTGSALLIIAESDSLFSLLGAAVLLGSGAGAVDAGLNGYVARHYSGRHMNWLHACWGLGATCGPLFIAHAMKSEAGWRGGYFGIGITQLALAAVFLGTLGWWSKVPERAFGADPAKNPTGPRTLGANTPAGWLSAAIFVVYVAIETTAGLWAASILVESRGIPKVQAALCVSAYYASITAGRLLSGLAVEHWGNRRVIQLGTGVALAGAVVFLFAPTTASAACGLVLLGLGFAPVYPGLMHEVPARFAPEAVQAVIGRQSGAAYLGSASLPALAGWLAQVSLESIPWLVLGGVVVLIGATRTLDRMT